MVAVQSSRMDTFEHDQTASAEVESPVTHSLAVTLQQEAAARELAHIVNESLGVNFTSPIASERSMFSQVCGVVRALENGPTR